jgi:hypothetical protein
MESKTSEETLFEVIVLEEVPEGYVAETLSVAGAAGNSCTIDPIEI